MDHVLSIINTGLVVAGAGLFVAFLVWAACEILPIDYVPKGSVGVSNTGDRETDKIVHQGEGGVQPRLLLPGARYGAFRSRVTIRPLVSVPNGCIGVVTAHVGRPATGLTAPYMEDFGDFTNLEQFLERGGQQGVQEAVLPPGTYAIHPDAFEVLVITENGDHSKVYGLEANATQELWDSEPHTTTTPAGIVLVIEPFYDSLAVRMAGAGDRAVRCVDYVVTSVTPAVTIEWEVGIATGMLPNGEQLSRELLMLGREQFSNLAGCSPAEFYAKLEALQTAASGKHFVQITEAVMLLRLAKTQS